MIEQYLVSKVSDKSTLTRLHYVRYADDYLIGIKGPKSLAIEIKDKTSKFLKSDLGLSVKGTGVIHSPSSKATFLGFDIKTPSRKERKVVNVRRIQNFTKLRVRIINRKHMMELRKNRMLENQFNKIVLIRLKALFKEKGEIASVKKFGNFLANDLIKNLNNDLG
jgi:hypothetical protein